MKKLTATLLASSLLGLAAYAQGTVNFVNVNAGAGLNAPIFLNDGTTKVGAGFTAELLAGSSAANLASVAQTAFLTGGGAGYFNGGTVAIPGITGASGNNTAFLEVRVFANSSGSYAAASAAGLLNTYGSSGVFSVTVGNPASSPPGTPAALVGLTSFNLNPAIPEPSSLALAGLGAAALLAFRRRK